MLHHLGLLSRKHAHVDDVWCCHPKLSQFHPQLGARFPKQLYRGPRAKSWPETASKTFIIQLISWFEPQGLPLQCGSLVVVRDLVPVPRGLEKLGKTQPHRVFTSLDRLFENGLALGQRCHLFCSRVGHVTPAYSPSFSLSTFSSLTPTASLLSLALNMGICC
jgi:hypothetical protein